MKQVMHIWLSGSGGIGKTTFAYKAIEPFAKENGWHVLTIEEDCKTKPTEAAIERASLGHNRVLIIHETLRPVGIIGGKS